MITTIIIGKIKEKSVLPSHTKQTLNNHTYTIRDLPPKSFFTNLLITL